MSTPQLTNKQTMFSIIYGVVLWFLAAMMVRYLGPMGAFEGVALLITYALVIPGTVPFIWLGQRLMGLSTSQLSHAVVVITATALLLDGLAFNFFRSLYGSDLSTVMAGSALILWGAGIGLVLGIVMGAARRGAKA
jgi:hypothetical protein